MKFNDLTSIITDHLFTVRQYFLSRDFEQYFNTVVKQLSNDLADSSTVFACGNGGSSSDAAHFVAELVGRFETDRAPLKAVALGQNMSNVTAISNDYGYEHVFSRELQSLGRPGDWLIAITTSGKSANVMAAIEVAKLNKMNIIMLSGLNNTYSFDDYPNGYIFNIPNRVTARIQECHILLLHLIAQRVEEHIVTVPGFEI